MQGQSPSGFESIPTLQWGSHVSQFYETGDELRDLLVPYFKAGLENGESCLWVTGAPFGANQARSALREAVGDFDAREKRGQIEIRDAHEWYEAGAKLKPEEIVAGLVRRTEEALGNGYQGLRTHGNCAWVEPDQWDDFKLYERLVQKAMRGRRMICMCGYCRSTIGGAQALDIIEHHDFILPRLDKAIALDAEGRVMTLAREMHHRVNNTLMTVQAVVRATMRHATTMEDFKRSLSARIEALSQTHALLTDRMQPSASLRHLLGNELGMYMDDEEGRVTLSGPEIMLPERLAVTIGMALHELATNAAKYGALSVSEGILTVDWSLAGGDLELRWRERNVPMAKKITRTGFGTRLLTELLPRQLDARIDLSFETDGLNARLLIPIH